MDELLNYLLLWYVYEWFDVVKSQCEGKPPTYRHDADLEALFHLQQLGEDEPRVLIDKHRGDDGIGMPRRGAHDNEALIHLVVHDSGHCASTLGIDDLDFGKADLAWLPVHECVLVWIDSTP